jgi:hypothetical protein
MCLHNQCLPFEKSHELQILLYVFQYFVIAQFVARSNGYEVEGQTGVTGTYPTQCHHDGEVLSL